VACRKRWIAERDKTSRGTTPSSSNNCCNMWSERRGFSRLAARSRSCTAVLILDWP